MLLGDGERRHDHGEDEQVVDGEALLQEVASEVLRPVLPARPSREDEPERHRHGDVEDRPRNRVVGLHRVRPRGGQWKIQRQ